PAAAARLLESLARDQPESAFMQLELARAYAADGRNAAALAALRRAVALDAELADAWRECAAQLFAAGEISEGDRADARYRSLVREPPELGDARVALANKRLQAAETILRRHLLSAPHDEVALRMLADVLLRREDQDEAERCLRKCLALAPGYAAARLDLAHVLYAQQRIVELLPMVERLLASQPDNVEYLSFKAAALRLVGRNDEAIALMEGVVATHPDNDQAWVLFGNRGAVTAECHGHVALYTAGFFAGRRGWGSLQRQPIFIVGVPRSGSTLLEQMLASHSQVEGTHELSDIAAIAFQLWSDSSGAERLNYPQPVAALDQRGIEACAAGYLSRTQPYRPLGRPHFVDKMLGNFGHIGFIHLMFPHAAIIDVRRHPLACGFSCYKQLFIRGQKFSYDLRELGLYYRDYITLMEHFDSVLPRPVHRVHYEQLISDPEGELRKLLDYCGLPFEEQCLRFYE